MVKRIIKNIFSTITVVTILFILIVSFGLSIKWGERFIIDYASNILATYSGVILALLAASLAENKREEKIEVAKKFKVMEGIYEELQENGGYLSNWKSQNIEMKIRDTIKLSALLTDEVWRAFSDGGELQWIKDISLLVNLSAAYSKIVSIKYLSNKYFELAQYSRKIDQATLQEIMKTLETNVDLATNILDDLIKWIGITTNKPEFYSDWVKTSK